MEEEVVVKKSLIRRILKDAIASGTKVDFILDAFLNTVNSNTIRYITDVLSDIDGDVDLVYPGDFIKFKAPKSYVDKRFNPDILNEMGFLSIEKDFYYVYAVVLGDESWNSGYNPYYGKIKVSAFFHDDQKQVSYYNESLSTGDVIKIQATDIPKFSTKYEGYKDHVSQLAKLEPLI
jgi:nucleoid DNA-binding protein